MSEVRRILSWISKSTAGTAPVRSGKMSAGDLNLQMALQRRTGFYDPFDLRFGKQTRISIRSSLKFKYHTPRRIKFTPFVTTCGYYHNIFLWTIDFTEVSDPKACYRIVLFQCPDRAALPVFRIEKNGVRAGNRIYEIAPGFFIQTGATWQTAEEDEYIRLNPVPDDYGEACATLQFGDRTRFLPEDEPNMLFRKLTKESEFSRSVYPLKYFFTGGPTDLPLEEIWSNQVLLTADGRAEQSVFTAGKGSDNWLPWLQILSNYFPHTGLTEQLQSYADTYRRSGKRCTPRAAYLIQRVCMEVPVLPIRQARDDLFSHVSQTGDQVGTSGDQPDPGYFYRAMFGESPGLCETVNRLQEWWNRYTMPVYNHWWQKERDSKPELFFIIYLLALRHKMPWSEMMSERCDGFSDIPLFALLAKMSSRILLDEDLIGNLIIRPGSERDSNVVRTPAREISIQAAYTKFGPVTYFSLRKNKREVLKVDKEVVCVVDKSSQNFSLLPNIYPPRADDFTGSCRIVAEFGTDLITIPLAWRKGMLRFRDVRLRWLLKRERFQITIMAHADLEGYRINDQAISLKRGQRKILYVYPQKGLGSANLSILTDEGRTIHERKKSGRRPINLSGWASDRYGVFIPVVNIRHHIKQHPIDADDAGQFSAQVKIPSETGRISLLARRFTQEYELRFMREPGLAKFLKSDPAATGNLRILIDRQAGIDPAKLLNYFEREFGFFSELIMVDPPYPDGLHGDIIVIPAGKSSNEQPVRSDALLVIPTPPDKSLDRMIRDELCYLQG